jgi:hypothetical protein
LYFAALLLLIENSLFLLPWIDSRIQIESLPFTTLALQALSAAAVAFAFWIPFFVLRAVVRALRNARNLPNFGAALLSLLTWLAVGIIAALLLAIVVALLFWLARAAIGISGSILQFGEWGVGIVLGVGAIVGGLLALVALTRWIVGNISPSRIGYALLSVLAIFIVISIAQSLRGGVEPGRHETSRAEGGNRGQAPPPVLRFVEAPLTCPSMAWEAGSSAVAETEVAGCYAIATDVPLLVAVGRSSSDGTVATTGRLSSERAVAIAGALHSIGAGHPPAIYVLNLRTPIGRPSSGYDRRVQIIEAYVAQGNGADIATSQVAAQLRTHLAATGDLTGVDSCPFARFGASEAPIDLCATSR